MLSNNQDLPDGRHMGELKLKKWDKLIFFIAVFVSAVLFFFLYSTQEGDRVLVTANGQVEEYPLNRNRTIKLLNGEHYNLISIEQGRVSMTEADCPDKLCVKHKAVYRNGEMIICLPNEIFIQIESSEEKEIDN